MSFRNEQARAGSPGTQNPLLCARRISVRTGTRALVSDVSLELNEGEFLGLIGPNGAGKTTLLKSLAHLNHYQGEVHLADQSIRQMPANRRARLLAYLAQEDKVSWPLSVRDFVALGRTPYKTPWPAKFRGFRSSHNSYTIPGRSNDQTLIASAIEQTGLGGLTQRPMNTLSGGERARARLARAIAVDAPLLLIDEPVAALDPYYQLNVMELLKAQCQQGKSVIVILHDLTLASRFCQRLMLLDQGKVIASGEPRTVLTPKNLQRVYSVRAMVGEHQQQPFVVPWSCERPSRAPTHTHNVSPSAWQENPL